MSEQFRTVVVGRAQDGQWFIEDDDGNLAHFETQDEMIGALPGILWKETNEDRPGGD